MLQRMWRRLAVVATASALSASALFATPAEAADGLLVDQQAACTYSPTTTAADCGYPTAATTGVPPGTSLTPVTGTPLRITEDGAVVEGIHLTGWLQIEASNVTIRNSVVTSTSWWGILFGQTNQSATNLTIDHVTVDSVPGQGPDNGGYDYGIAAAGTGSMDVAFADVSGFKDGIDISLGSVRDSYVHDLSQFTGAHTQAVYAWCGGAGLTLEHNTFVNQTDQDYSTAAIYIAPDCGHQNAVTVHDNWLAGGAYVLYGGDTTATNIRVTDNAFSTEIVSPSCGYYGTHAYWFPDNAGNVFTGNVHANGPAYGSTVDP